MSKILRFATVFGAVVVLVGMANASMFMSVEASSSSPDYQNAVVAEQARGPDPPVYQNKTEVKVVGDTSITMGAPAGFNAGDLFIALVSKDDDPAITLPVGGTWTLIQEGADLNSNGCYFSVSYRIAQGGDINWTWTGDNEGWWGVILRYTGHDGADPIDVSDITRGATTNTPIAPSVLTTRDDCIVLVAFGADHNDVPYFSPGTHVERYNDSVASTGGAGADVVKAVQGNTGAASFTMNAAEQWVAVTVAIQRPVIAPVVTTQVASSVEETSATLNGDITSTGGADCDERGFVWDTVTHGDPGNVAPAGTAYASNWTEVGVYGTGAFNHGIAGLTEGELYYVRSCVHNVAGWSYGAEITFLTKPDEPTNLGDTAHTNNTIDVQWVVGAGSQKTMVRYRTDHYPVNVADGIQVHFAVGNTAQAAGLGAGQIHYFRAWSYATEGGKEKYSDLTSDDTAYTSPADPTNMAVSNPKASLDVDWTKGAGGDKTMVRYAVGGYPANPAGGIQAYFDTGVTVVVGGLEFATTHYYRGWAYDTDSGYYSDGYSEDFEVTASISAPPPPGEDGEYVYLEIRPELDFNTIRTQAKPTHVRVGAFDGWSLPIYNNDNEELFFEICVPDRWNGDTDILLHIDICLANANEKGNNYRLQIDWEHYTPDDDAVPVTSNPITIDRAVTSDTQYQSYKEEATIDFDIDVGDEIVADDILAFRIISVDATNPDIAGEVIIVHVGVLFARGDLLGYPDPLGEDGILSILFIEEDEMILLALIVLALGLMVFAYTFKRPAFAFGSTAGWLILALYAYGKSAVLWDYYYGLFWFSIALMIISALEGMALRTKHEEELEGEQSDLDKYLAKAKKQREKMEQMDEALGGSDSIRSRKKKRSRDDTRLG